MAAGGWHGELEAQKLLLDKQQSQIDAQRSQIDALQKQLGCTPEDAEVDLPAAEYNRVFAATIALLVYNVASLLVSSFTAGGIEGNLSQAEYLLWPLCWTALFGLCYGTLDSAEAGRRSTYANLLRRQRYLSPYPPLDLWFPRAGFRHSHPIFN